MMVSWAIMGYFTMEAMKVPEREIVVQTMDEDKSHEMIGYAKTLWSRQDQRLRDTFPVAKPVEKMAKNEFSLANGSVIWGIPSGQGKIRSYHPWGYFSDESAFQDDAGECYGESLAAVEKIVLNSTAGPGWYYCWLNDIDDKV
jgi:hypothetical protein